MDELKCQHCGEQGMDEEFMVKVEALRHELGFLLLLHLLTAAKTTS